MDFNLFYLENRTSPNSNIAYFWRKGGSGYTARIEEAQMFSDVEADQIIRSAEGSHKFIKHKVGDVEDKAFRAVNIEDLRSASQPPCPV